MMEIRGIKSYKDMEKGWQNRFTIMNRFRWFKFYVYMEIGWGAEKGNKKDGLISQ